MAKVLSEYFRSVDCSDADDYGYGKVRDFIERPYPPRSFDWVISNAPFKLAEEFVLRALDVARDGVAIFARPVFIESVKRYRNIAILIGLLWRLLRHITFVAWPFLCATLERQPSRIR